MTGGFAPRDFDQFLRSRRDATWQAIHGRAALYKNAIVATATENECRRSAPSATKSERHAFEIKIDSARFQESMTVKLKGQDPTLQRYSNPEFVVLGFTSRHPGSSVFGSWKSSRAQITSTPPAFRSEADSFDGRRCPATDGTM